MLTSDLVRARVRSGVVEPRYVSPSNSDVRHETKGLIALHEAHVGASMGELEQAIGDHIGDSPRFMLQRGLSKLLLDRGKLEVVAPRDPGVVREAVFRWAAEKGPVAPGHGSRETIINAAAAELGLNAQDVDRALYADLKSSERLQSIETPEVSTLLHRYNLALAQAVLLRATRVRVELPQIPSKEARFLFRSLKFHRLMHRITRSKEGYRLELDGPLSLFKLTTRYGLGLALFLPTLCSGLPLVVPNVGGAADLGHPRRDASGDVLTKDRSAEAAARLKSLDLVGLICIGGDGTLRMARDFFVQHGVPVIGVPKTIDFDLSGTEATFGFKTAVQVATDALDRLRTTADSHDRVMVLELMGRYAGWIALNAGVAGGAHVILIPEIPYDPEIVWRRVTGRFRRHKHFSLVVISEGARTLEGDYAVAEVREHPDGLPILGGAGQRLRHQLEAISRREAETIRKSGGNPPESPEIRTVVLGHIQRGGTPLGDDRIIATSCGSFAIDMVARGKVGCMSAWSFSGPKPVPLDDALAEHFVDPLHDPLVTTARDIGVSFGSE